MLRLFVMRHAKSSWASPGARDFDRELNERGRLDLITVSKVLRERGYIPDEILCSSAERTRQTLDGIRNILPDTTKITYTEKLYSSGLDDYIGLLQSQDTSNSIMIIGHNPMCGTLASSMSGYGKSELLEEIAYKYPTSTVSVIDFKCDNWSEITKGNGTLEDCIIPSSL